MTTETRTTKTRSRNRTAQDWPSYALARLSRILEMADSDSYVVVSSRMWKHAAFGAYLACRDAGVGAAADEIVRASSAAWAEPGAAPGSSDFVPHPLS